MSARSRWSPAKKRQRKSSDAEPIAALLAKGAEYPASFARSAANPRAVPRRILRRMDDWKTKMPRCLLERFQLNCSRCFMLCHRETANEAEACVEEAMNLIPFSVILSIAKNPLGRSNP